MKAVKFDINDYLKDDAELQKIVIGELLQEIQKQKNILETIKLISNNYLGCDRETLIDFLKEIQKICDDDL